MIFTLLTVYPVLNIGPDEHAAAVRATKYLHKVTIKHFVLLIRIEIIAVVNWPTLNRSGNSLKETISGIPAKSRERKPL